ncbi:MAG: HD domain-containing protein [Chitinophagales bacterium]
MNLSAYLEHPIFKTVGQVADQNQMEAYVVGGFVRDLLLKRGGKDIDFVCVGSGIALAEKTAAAIHPKIKVNVFKNFGTAHFAHNGWDFEFVGARKESYQRHSRNPIVEEGTLQDDQNRRDFTINAMAISLNEANYGALIDPFNGLEDIGYEVIKTPLDPDITFSDDPLRMMRAIRFATQLNFYIEEKTLEAITRNRERIRIISQERITDELNKIILSKKPSVGFRLLEETGLLPLIFPEMQALKGVQTVDDKSHKDNFYHTLQVLDNICLTSKDLWVRWAAILHDIAKPVTKRFEPGTGWTFHGHEVVGSKWVPRIFRQLKLPQGHEMKLVQKLVYLHLRPIALSKEEISDAALRRLLFEAGDDLEALMTLCEADITSKNKVKVTRFLKNFEIVRQKLKDVEERDSIRNFQPPVSGELIMQTFGIGPSREVGLIKDRIKEAILEGEIKNDYYEAHALMMKLGAELGLKQVSG